MSGRVLLGPRCGEPMEFYDYPGRTDYAPVCWRPAGHGPRSDGQPRHLSRYAIEHRREARRGISHKRRQELAA